MSVYSTLIDLWNSVTTSNGSDSIRVNVVAGGGGGGGGAVQLQDGAGNPITSQASAGQRALDIGVNVAGVQVDPRQIRALTSSDIVSARTVQFFTLPFDAITASYPSATQEVYETRTGGIGGSVVQTLTVNYTDASKNVLQDAAVV